MSGHPEVLTLIAEIRKSREVLGRIATYYEGHFATSPRRPETTENAIVLAEVMNNYYTCAETIFLRISQHFENCLATENWHKDLLRKMTLTIPDIRPQVVDERTFADLEELLRFRHFHRYYLEFNYDWERLRVAESRFGSVRKPLDRALDEFERYLLEVSKL